MSNTIPLKHAGIVTLQELVPHIKALRTQGKSIVFTNGCFDILHPGHADLLARAKALGDILVLGLNTDASVKRLNKSPERPINNYDSRAFVAIHLESVDFVTSFDEDTPLELITALLPDVLVKGGDWAPEQIVGRDIVMTHGGAVHSLPLLGHYSTTKLVQHLQGNMTKHDVYLALGSNLGDSRMHLKDACEAIKALPGIKVINASPIYKTNPQLVTDQADFMNQVLHIQCDNTWTPETLLQTLLTLETHLGRVRDTAERFGPRIIDIDILVFDSVKCATKTLILPHPRMYERAFVLVPLTDIAPDLAIPHADIFTTPKALLSTLTYSILGEYLTQNFEQKNNKDVLCGNG